MKRRTLLRTSAAAVGGGGAALGGLRLFSGASSAQTAVSLDVVGDSATLDAEDSVAAVVLNLSVDWAYDLPSGSTPDTVVVEIAAAEGDDELAVVDSADSAQLFTSADGSESFDVDLIAEGALSASSLTPSSGERETDVTIEARLRVLGGDTVLARDSVSDVATVTIERDAVNPDEYGSVGGSGSLSIEIA